MRGHGCFASYNSAGSFQTVMSDTIGRPPSTAKSIFLEALDLPADQRAALLDARCGADTPLRIEVKSIDFGIAKATQTRLTEPGGVWQSI